MRSDYLDAIKEHYEQCWEAVPNVEAWDKGPVHQLPEGFSVLRFDPSPSRRMFTYATCGMSNKSDPFPLELHLFSPEALQAHVELLTVIVHFHRTGTFLGEGHTVNFGRPWMPNSNCDHGLISLPYLDGPSLELAEIGNVQIHFLWLVPITRKEVEYKKKFGLEALEDKLESDGFNYLDPNRKSVV
ncbi:MAG TPA: suppressor of fused domain protein [Pyrinomonadaceae bacterium]